MFCTKADFVAQTISSRTRRIRLNWKRGFILKTHTAIIQIKHCFIRRKLCIGRQPISRLPRYNPIHYWSKFCKRCETGDSIGLYSVSNNDHNNLKLAIKKRPIFVLKLALHAYLLTFEMKRSLQLSVWNNTRIINRLMHLNTRYAFHL